MTSRRAMRSWDARLSRALQFAPGHASGRVDSAQPVNRRGGTLRRASVGAAGVKPPPPAFAGLMLAQGLASTGTSGNFELNDDTSMVTPASGQVAIAVVGCFEATITPPTGWTSLESGTVGRLTYWVGYVVVTGTDDWTVNLSPAYNFSTWATTSAGYVDAMTLVFDSTSLTPASAVSEQAGTNSVTVPTPTGSGPWSAFIAGRTPFNSNQTACAGWPTGMNLLPDLIELGRGSVAGAYGGDPIGAPGTVSYPYYDVDAVALSLRWS